jgi:NADH-quinone oxidoreductase subunit B
VTDRGTEAIRIGQWVRPLLLDLGCCGTAALQIGAPGYGIPGFEGSAHDLNPDQATVLVVAGRVAPAFADRLAAIHGRLAPPAWVIAYGTCALSGALLGTLATAQIIPVDTMIGGCPPPPDALLEALARVPRRRPS